MPDKILYFLQRLTSYIPVPCDVSCPLQPISFPYPPFHLKLFCRFCAFRILHYTFPNKSSAKIIFGNNVSTALCTASEQRKTSESLHVTHCQIFASTGLIQALGQWGRSGRRGRASSGIGDERDPERKEEGLSCTSHFPRAFLIDRTDREPGTGYALTFRDQPSLQASRVLFVKFMVSVSRIELPYTV